MRISRSRRKSRIGSNSSRTWLRGWTWILGSLCVALLTACTAGRDASLDRKASKVTIGMTTAQVKSLLGKPDSTTTETMILINFGPDDGKKVPNPNVAYFYRGEIDYTVCVVFDKRGKVTYVTKGGT